MSNKPLLKREVLRARGNCVYRFKPVMLSILCKKESALKNDISVNAEQPRWADCAGSIEEPQICLKICKLFKSCTMLIFIFTDIFRYYFANKRMFLNSMLTYAFLSLFPISITKSM